MRIAKSAIELDGAAVGEDPRAFCAHPGLPMPEESRAQHNAMTIKGGYLNGE
jgi:hypothetical protein